MIDTQGGPIPSEGGYLFQFMGFVLELVSEAVRRLARLGIA